jgi:RNA polymerase sigma factor (sigma-70 family)
MAHVSDRNAFFTANYPDILRIVAKEAHRHRRDDLGTSVEDLIQEGLLFALRALEHVDLEIGWHGYIKTAVGRNLAHYIADLTHRRQRQHEVAEAPGMDSAAPEVLGPRVRREETVESVKRRAAGRVAISEFREKLSPAARHVLDLTIHPPLALLIMTRNEEGRAARPQARHVAQFSGLPHQQVERAHVEIWKKARTTRAAA